MRGVLGMGSNRLNKYVLRKAVQGVANYILKCGQSAASRGVAIAHDSRHFQNLHVKPLVFWQQMAFMLIYTQPPNNTFLIFAIRQLNCISGFCITASHNPPQYNGIKVYYGKMEHKL